MAPLQVKEVLLRVYRSRITDTMRDDPAARPRRASRKRFLLCARKLAALAAVEVVDDKPDGEPDEEADPGDDRQPRHQKNAEGNAQNRQNRAAGTAESAAAAGIFVAQYEHAGGDKHEGEERADIREIGEGADIEQPGRHADDESRHPRCRRRSAEARVNLCE